MMQLDIFPLKPHKKKKSRKILLKAQLRNFPACFCSLEEDDNTFQHFESDEKILVHKRIRT